MNLPGGRMAYQRFRAAKADRQLEKLQPVDEAERQGSVIVDDQRKG